MSELESRFGLNFPAVKLVQAPTPLESVQWAKRPELDLWVKRDSETNSVYGGNKSRKLEYLLGAAKYEGATRLITTGAWGSHHAFATAMHGIAHGFEVELVLVPQPWNAHVEENLLGGIDAGARVFNVRPSLVPATIAARKLRARSQGGKAYVITHGGSQPHGVLGYVEAGLELVSQLEESEHSDFDEIVVALGSGGTVAGLAIALAAVGRTTKVRAVRVTPAAIANRFVLHKLIRSTLRLLRRDGRKFPDVLQEAMALINIDSAQYGRGYGVPTKQSNQAHAQAPSNGLVVDPTYTAKALAVALGSRPDARILYWHTLSSATQKPVDSSLAPDWFAQARP